MTEVDTRSPKISSASCSNPTTFGEVRNAFFKFTTFLIIWRWSWEISESSLKGWRLHFCCREFTAKEIAMYNVLNDVSFVTMTSLTTMVCNASVLNSLHSQILEETPQKNVFLFATFFSYNIVASIFPHICLRPLCCSVVLITAQHHPTTQICFKSCLIAFKMSKMIF